MRPYVEQPEKQNWRLELPGLAKLHKTRRLIRIGTGMGLDRWQDWGQVFGLFWDKTEPFWLSEPRPLPGYPDPLLTLHRVIKTSPLTFKKPKHKLQYYLVMMWTHIGIQHSSWLSQPNDYKNWTTGGLRIENIFITSHSSQHRKNGPASIASWKVSGHSDPGPCGCQRGILLLSIMLSLCTMTCSIIWMALYELGLGRRLNGRTSCTSPWSLYDTSGSIIMWK